MPDSPLRRHLRLCTYDGLAAMPIVYLVQPGNFVVAGLLTGLYHLPPELYGWIAALPFLGNFAQAFLMPLVNGFLSPKMVAVAAAWVQMVCWAGLAVALPFLPTAQPAVSGPWFFGFAAVSAMATAFTAVGWSSWVQEWVPPRIMGKYFGRRNRVLQIATVGFLAFTGWLLTAWAGSVAAFQGLLAGVALLRIGSCVAQQRLRAGEGPARGEERLPWRAQLAVLGRNPAFLWLVAFGAAWGFAANCFGPFYPVFLYDVVGLSTRGVSGLMILTSVGGALSYPAWGALADRFGNKPVILFCMLALQAQNYLWCFVRPGSDGLLWFMWSFGGIVSAGLILGLFNLMLKIIPPEAKTLALSLNLAFTALATALAPVLGGYALAHFLGQPGRRPIEVYHAAFLVQPTLAILACLLLARVRETDSQPLARVVGAMRNIRTLGGVLGLGFLVEYVFEPNRKKPAIVEPDQSTRGRF